MMEQYHKYEFYVMVLIIIPVWALIPKCVLTMHNSKKSFCFGFCPLVGWDKIQEVHKN